MALPADHPPVHAHKGKTCPVVGNGHEWCRLPTDSRSPCPALNVLANHVYLPRDGKNINVFNVTSALKQGYNLSTPLAVFLSFGGFAILRRFGNISLYEIGRHGRVEHNASLVHADTPTGELYAPVKVHKELVELLIRDVRSGADSEEGLEKKTLMTPPDVARARIRREKESPPLDGVHAEIARGEMAIILGVLEANVGKNVGIPVEWMREWIGEEKLPTGWKPTRCQGLLNTVKRSKAIKQAMEDQRQAEAKGKKES